MMRAALADGVYADLSPDEVRDVLSLLDDLEEALARSAQVDSMREAIESLRTMHTTSARELALRAELAALRGVAEAARARCRDAVPEWAPELRAALRAWEERER